MFVSRVLMVCAMSIGLGGATTFALEDVSARERVRNAIQHAVAVRVGPASTVVAEIMDVRIADNGGALVAVIDPAARVGQATRFAILSGDGRRTRVGEATAVVHVATDSVQVRERIARGEVVRESAIQIVRVELDGRSLTALPTPADVVGARAARDLETGTTIGEADLMREPLVKAGDHVRAVVRVSGVEVSATVVTLQAGGKDDMVSLVNTGTRKTFRGRVTGPGEVEVIDVR